MGNEAEGFKSLVGAIVASYESDAKTRHIDSGHMPNRDTIIEIVKLMR